MFGTPFAEHRLLHWLPILRLTTTFAKLLSAPDGTWPIWSSSIDLPTDHQYMMVNAHVIYVRNLGLPYTVEWHIENMSLPITATPDDEYATRIPCQTTHAIHSVGHPWFNVNAIIIASFMANGFTTDGAWIGVIDSGEEGADILVPRQNRYCNLMRLTVAYLLFKGGEPVEAAGRWDSFYWKVSKTWFLKAIDYISRELVRPCLPLGHNLQLSATLRRMDNKPTWIDGVPNTFDAEQPIDVLLQLHVTFMSVK
jgi:hypothetical protein